MLLEEKIKKEEEKKRISEIKSTKLLFTSNMDTNPIHNKGIVIKSSARNNLRKMSFQ